MTLPGSNYVFNDLFFKNQHQIFFENIISEIMKTLLKVPLNLIISRNMEKKDQRFKIT